MAKTKEKKESSYKARKDRRKYTEENIEHICQALRDGTTRTAAFQAGRIGKKTFYEWLHEEPEFARRVKEAEAEARERIERRLFRLCEEGDRFAIMYYLQNRYPDDWKDTRNFKIDQELTFKEKEAGGLTDEQLIEKLKQADVDTTFLEELANDDDAEEV